MEETTILVRHTGIYVKVLTMSHRYIYFSFPVFWSECVLRPDIARLCEQTRLCGPDEGWSRRSGARHTARHYTRHTARHTGLCTAHYTAHGTLPIATAARKDRHTPLLYSSALGSTPAGLFIELGQTDTLQFAAQTFSL